MTMNKWAVPAFGLMIGLVVVAAALARQATPAQAAVSFLIVAGYAVALRLLQARSETMSLLSGLPVDERWAAINQRALAVAAQGLASIILGGFLITQFTGGDWRPYAMMGAAFATFYVAAILWYRWRQ
jgi:hypothetical protein